MIIKHPQSEIEVEITRLHDALKPSEQPILEWRSRYRSKRDNWYHSVKKRWQDLQMPQKLKNMLEQVEKEWAAA